MTTIRLRYDTGAAGITPGVASTWTSFASGSRANASTAVPVALPLSGTLPAGGSSAVACARQFVTTAADAAALVGRTGSGTFRALLNGRRASGVPSGRFRIIVRVVSADGTTVRGTLFNGTALTDLTTSNAWHKFAGALTPVATQAGDRIVAEVGADMAAGSSSVAMSFAGSSGNPDADYTTPAATDRPWLELILDDPPNAPTGLVQTAATATTATIDWTAPATGPAPTSYDIRIDGALPIGVGPGTDALIPGLAPGTTYAVEVRAVSAGGVSAWAGPIAVATIGPPDPVTGLELVTVTTSTFTVGWDAVPDADGYLVYVAGVLVADYPASTLTHTATALDAGTGYMVQVYAYNVAGEGEPGELLVTTVAAPSGYYRATVVVGAHTWTAERADAPQLGPLLPLDLGWELPDDAPGIPAQPNPDTCTLSILTAEALPDVATGTPARVTVWLNPSPGARPFATMAGEVGDLEIFPQQLPDGSHGVLSRMLLVGHETRPNAYRVGSQPWPAESGAARAGRIMAEAGQLEWSTPIPVGNDFAERPARETPKGDALTQALTEAAVYVAGDYSPPARHLWHATADEAGNLDAFTAELVAAETTAIDVLDGAWVNRAASWRRTRRRDGAWVQVTHPGGVTIYGRPGGPPMPPVTLEVTDPDPYADLLLSSLYANAWLSGEWFRVHLHAEDCPPYGLEWFRRDDASPGFPAASRAVVVDNIQVVPGLFTRYGGMLAGARLVIEPGGRVMLLFRLRPDVPAWSVVTPRWMDEDPAATWADEAPTATWAELRTTPREDA